MYTVIEAVIEDLDNAKRRNVDGQIGFGDLVSEISEKDNNPVTSFIYPECDEFPTDTLLKYEKEVSGMYLSGHPMLKYDALSKSLRCANISDIIKEDTSFKDNERVVILGLIGSIKKKITKNDSTMAFLNFEDINGSIEVIVFPKTLMENPSIFFEGNIILLRGRVSIRDDEETKIVCESVEACPSVDSAGLEKKPVKKKAQGLFLRFDTSDSPQIELCRRLLAIFDGNTPLYFYFSNQNKYIPNPIKQGIDVNPVLLRELRKILGEQNVIYNN
jgi:DNA polymerase-3 subunit alpha